MLFVFQKINAQTVTGSLFYDLQKGMPSNISKSILQDSLGFIWIGTDDALVRFDGQNFISMLNDEQSPYIKFIYADKQNNIWVSSDLGLFKTKPSLKEPILQRIMLAGNPSDTSLGFSKGIFQDSKGRLWISEHQAIARLDNLNEKKVVRFPFDREHHSMSFVRSFRVLEDESQRIIATSQQGAVFIFDEIAQKFELAPLTKPDSNFQIDDLILFNGEIVAGSNRGVYVLSNPFSEYPRWDKKSKINLVTSLYPLNTSTLVVGTQGQGLFKIFTGENWRSQEFNPSQSRSLTVENVIKDREGNVWVASTEGVVILPPNEFSALTFPQLYQYTHTVSVGPDSTVYTASESAVFRIEHDKNNRVLTKLFDFPELGYVISLAANDSEIWFGTTGGEIFKWSDRKLQKFQLPVQDNQLERHVYYLSEDIHKNLWIVQSQVEGIMRRSPSGEIRHYTSTDGLNFGVTVSATHPNGSFYTAGFNNNSAIARYNNTTDTFESVPILTEQNQLWENISIEDMSFDESGKLWMGTSVGLLSMDVDMGIARLRAMPQNKRSNFIRGVLPVGKSYVWISTTQGIFLYNVLDDYLARFDLTDGLPHQINSFRSLKMGKNGQIWSGTDKGLAFLKRGFSYNRITPTPIFSGYSIDGSQFQIPTKIPEISEKSLFQMEWKTLSFPDNRLTYTTRILGLEEEWTNNSDRRISNLRSFPPGNYVFQVKAKQQTKGFSQIVDIPIVVVAQWYNTVWARILFLTLGFGLLLFIRAYSLGRRQQEKFKKALKETELRLDTILANVPVVLFAFDKHTKFTLSTGKVLDKIGLHESELVGKSFKDFYPPEYHEYIDKVMLGESVRYKRTIDGLTLETQIAPIMDENDEIYGAIGVGIDITDVEKNQKDLQEAKEVAEKANAAKSDFLANMSHELRTPLNAILGFAQILNRDHNLTPRNREHVEIMQKSGEHLLGMINDILDLSKIEAGHIDLHNSNFNLKMLLADLQNMFSVQANKKGLKLEFNVSSSIPSLVHCDQSKVRQILINLISNAVKYTDKGKVSFSVKADKEITSDICHFKFEIKDTGKGISQENLARIFDPFEQAADDYARGTGLGLSITDRLVHFLDGHIDVSSVEGQGSVFIVHIPMKLLSNESDLYKVVETPTKVVGLKSEVAPNILVVDDIKENRLVLTSMLEHIGFICIEAANGKEALEILGNQKIDAVLMDIVMPVMNGIDAVKAMRADDRFLNIPVSAVTASGFDKREVELLEHGFNRFVRKPFKEEEILLALSDLLDVEYLYSDSEASESFSSQPIDELIAEIQSLQSDKRNKLLEALELTDFEAIREMLQELDTDRLLYKALHTAIINSDYKFFLTLFDKMED